MGFLLDIWNAIKAGLESVLRFYEGLMEPFLGEAAWGLAIILLTVTVRVFMIPLMVRQTKSMRSMQAIQPEMKKIQEKYKADRSMMKTDPERYKKIKEKQREAQMELYQEHGVNPVGGCLPLLLQMPVFLALFQVLQEPGPLKDDLASASFLGFRSLTDTAQSILSGGETGFVLGAAISAVTLIVLQVGTTYWSQKQMMARNTNAAAEQAQVQKIMLYVMPFFLGFLSFTFPIGVVLYWVTTNFWTMGQQAIIFRQVEAQEVRKAEEREAARKDKSQRKDADDGSEDPSAKRRTGSKDRSAGRPGSP
ncbi:MAG TPA: YidC/Oxa1 family membrane protein insertase, partial [Euzebya sp.]|nr:YidC/Oxa1 family membrane protein insertase [Euzebya sp.]